MNKTYQTIVGMEVHVELKTKSKMFCGCKNDPFFADKPNIYTCPVCLGLPGALPVPNRKAIEWTIRLGLALGCDIPLESKFDRKNYFYPDLPKGYQISQYDQPFCVNGCVETDYGDVRIRRVHLEEDTGKLIHTTLNTQPITLIDFNRSGVPLVEIVTEPDILSGDHAKAYLKKLTQIIRYLDISDCDMEKGSMRCEPNISVMKSQVPNPKSQKMPSYKVEVKNINSYTFVKKAIDYETKRHIGLLEKGETPKQETRGWNEGKNETVPQRSKEEADDYRYFPEPDIPPFVWTDEFISTLRSTLPELPDAKRKRFESDYVLNAQDSAQLTESAAVADYFEEAVRVGRDLSPKKIANWMINRKIDIDEVMSAKLVERIVEASKTVDVDDVELEKIVKEVLAANPKAVADYKSGKTQVMMFLVGQVMKKSDKKIEIVQLQQLILEKLKKYE